MKPPKNPPHLVLIDNFDSFTFNLADALATLGARVDVYRNTIGAKTVLRRALDNRSAMIVLSPGPGAPQDAGCTVDLIRLAAGRIPLFGVCLGHQAMAFAFGGRIGPAGAIAHGKKSRVRHDGHPLFKGLPDIFEVGRYHSLAVQAMPDMLQCIATLDGGGAVMALAHRALPVYGVQFHPESILTAQGQTVLANVLELAQAARQARSPDGLSFGGTGK